MSRKINTYIDHTKLSATTTRDEVIQLCTEAKEHSFASVCIPPVYVKLAAKELQGSNVAVCTVIGFPLAYNTLNTQLSSGVEAISSGATEIDIVVPQYLIKNQNWNKAHHNMSLLTMAFKSKEAKVKWILETANLTQEEIVRLSQTCVAVHADFVKTSTGFASSGAQLKDVALIREVVGTEIGIKASGGIRTKEQAHAFIDAGATRIGTSSGIKLVQD